jgi:hypothetical protein
MDKLEVEKEGLNKEDYLMEQTRSRASLGGVAHDDESNMVLKND